MEDGISFCFAMDAGGKACSDGVSFLLLDHAEAMTTQGEPARQ